MNELMDVLGTIGGILWGPWTPWTLLAAGVLATIFTRFTQVTAMTHGVAVVRGVYDDPDDPGAINHFQALSAALSATVGLGNIGGVALAIGAGGPGALVWMWIVGFFGMALKTVEITLAMMYRNTDDPENPSGGAMWVVDKVIGGKGGIWVPIAKLIGVFFCITLLISTFTGGNMFQSWSVATLTQEFFGVDKIVTGIMLAVIVGLVIIGGIKRIGNVAGRLVPFMCAIYVLAALAVLAMNISSLPGLFGTIFSSAFSADEGTGAFIGGSLGYAFMQGMKRALFSNEAGQGSAPIAHAAAKTDEPAREGIVGGIGPFIDTICICTITALVILSTNTWNRDAIGELPGTVELVAGADVLDDDGTVVAKTWSVNATTEVADLPESKYFEGWKKGWKLFMIAEVDALHLERGSHRIKVDGQIGEIPGEGEQPGTPIIEWDDVTLTLDEWDAPIDATSIRLRDAGIFREFEGAELTAHAFDRQFSGLGSILVTFAAWLFAISTMISWSYYGEQGMVYMLGQWSVLPYKLVYLVGVIVAAAMINDVTHMTTLMDLGTGAMLWSNLPIVICLGFLAVKCLGDYGRRLKRGEFPRHDAPSMVDVAEGHDVEKK